MRVNRNKIIAAVLLIFVTTGCLWFQNVRVPDRIIVDNSDLPALEVTDLLQSSLSFSPEITDIAARLNREADIDFSHWSVSIQHTLAGMSPQNRARLEVAAPGTPAQPSGQISGRVTSRADFLLSEHLNRITSQSRRIEWEGRTFYFLSIAVDTPGSPHSGVQFELDEYDDPSRVHRVYALDENGSGVTYFETEAVDPVFVTDGLPRSLPGQSLQFDVHLSDEGPVVVYRDRDGIFAKPLVFSGHRSAGTRLSFSVPAANLSGEGGSFLFGEKKQIAVSETPYGEYQLISRSDPNGVIHMIWTDSRGKNDLWYCRAGIDGNDICKDPRRISRTATQEPINLMLQNENRVFISWIDNRFKQGVWTARNFAKLMMVKSEDGGKTFGSTVSVNQPRDDSDNVTYSVTMPAPEDGILIFWGSEILGSQSKNQDLNYGWLHSGLDVLYLGSDKIPGTRLQEEIRNKLLGYHREF
jgi:hypothetical protein